MNYKSFFFLILSTIFTSYSFSQYQKPSLENFTIKGTAIEKETNKIMEYCTVSLYSKKDSSLITGGVSDYNGAFSLQTKKTGKYFLKISYIGFETSIVDNIILNPKNKIFDTNKVFLLTNSHSLNDVEVIGEKTTIRYEMDKKIIDVGKDISASNGSAVDVLENTPSIDVAIDGTVKLRGSSNFQVLINGKPSILSGKEALQQIPASNIKNIELITNPSAKYEAGNTAGIINIILKKEKKIGTSGMIRLSYGTFNNYNASINIKHNIKKFSFNFSASTRKHSRPRNGTDSLHTSFNEVNTTISKGIKTWAFGGYSFNYGLDYNLHKNHSINLDFVVGKWTMDVNGEEAINHKNETLQTEENYKYANNQERFADYFGPSLSYNGSFKNKSTLATYLGYAQRDFKEKVTNKRLSDLDILDEKDKTTETGFRQNITAKIDYSLPIKTGKLELGGRANTSWNDEKNNEFVFDTLNNNYRLLDYNNRNISYTQKVFGLYSNYSNKWKKLSFRFCDAW